MSNIFFVGYDIKLFEKLQKEFLLLESALVNLYYSKTHIDMYFSTTIQSNALYASINVGSNLSSLLTTPSAVTTAYATYATVTVGAGTYLINYHITCSVTGGAAVIYSGVSTTTSSSNMIDDFHYLPLTTSSATTGSRSFVYVVMGSIPILFRLLCACNSGTAQVGRANLSFVRIA